MTYAEALQREIDNMATIAELRCTRDGGTPKEARAASREARDRLAQQVEKMTTRPMDEALARRLRMYL